MIKTRRISVNTCSSCGSFSPLFVGETNVTRSLLVCCPRLTVFQSPFRRGNKCNTFPKDKMGRFFKSFSPLFVGETNVTILSVEGIGGLKCFQSPFRRGNKCNLTTQADASSQAAFQSPFRRGNKCNTFPKDKMGRFSFSSGKQM